MKRVSQELSIQVCNERRTTDEEDGLVEHPVADGTKKNAKRLPVQYDGQVVTPFVWFLWLSEANQINKLNQSNLQSSNDSNRIGGRLAELGRQNNSECPRFLPPYARPYTIESYA